MYNLTGKKLVSLVYHMHYKKVRNMGGLQVAKLMIYMKDGVSTKTKRKKGWDGTVSQNERDGFIWEIKIEGDKGISFLTTFRNRKWLLRFRTEKCFNKRMSQKHTPPPKRVVIDFLEIFVLDFNDLNETKHNLKIVRNCF